MLTVARIVFFCFAALLILGGIAGFVEKKSIPSLASGILCGGMGLYAALTITNKPTTALVVALIGAILAGGGMAPRLKNKETGEVKVWPGLVVVAASALTALVAAGALVTTRGTGTPPPAG